MELTLRRQLCGAKQNKKQTLLDTDADRSSYLVSKYKGEGQACIGDHFSASRSANDSRDDDAFDRYGNTVSPLCDRVTRLHWSAIARSMARVPGFLHLRTNRRPGIGLLFATLLERRRRLSSRNRVPDPFRGVCYGSLSSFLPPRSPGAWKTRASFFFTLRERDTVSRKKAKSLSVGIAVARRRNAIYYLNAYWTGWSFFLGKNRGSKGRTRCRDILIGCWTRWYIVRESVVIYDNRWGKGGRCGVFTHLEM